MPVSPATATNPFRGVAKNPELRLPQARLLRALAPVYPDWPQSEWPTLNRALLGVRAGYTAISGSVTRALDGIKRAGTKMGTPHPGLLALGYVEIIHITIEGVLEINYRATTAGFAAYQAFLDAGGELPPVKDASICTNARFKDK